MLRARLVPSSVYVIPNAIVAEQFRPGPLLDITQSGNFFPIKFDFRAQ